MALKTVDLPVFGFPNNATVSERVSVRAVMTAGHGVRVITDES